jgi:hypothetical protein
MEYSAKFNEHLNTSVCQAVMLGIGNTQMTKISMWFLQEHITCGRRDMNKWLQYNWSSKCSTHTGHPMAGRVWVNMLFLFIYLAWLWRTLSNKSSLVGFSLSTATAYLIWYKSSSTFSLSQEEKESWRQSKRSLGELSRCLWKCCLLYKWTCYIHFANR